jgi:riboflavin biosynthesis pyrimidine reductase
MDLCVLGSLKLTQSLIHAGLVDERVLLITPVVLGTGTKGAIIATHRRVRDHHGRANGPKGF